MSILDMFRNTQASQPAKQAGDISQPTQLPAANNPNMPVTNPAQPTTAGQAPASNGQAAAGAPASPMDSFNELWKNDPTNNGAQPAPLFDIDHAKLQEAVKTADFTKMLPPDLMQKALAGDQQAFAAAMNGVAQQVFSHQTMATTRLIEEAINKRDAKLTAMMPEQIRRAQISNNLAADPIYQHEATRPLVSALEAQLAQKYPQATAEQITEQARSYISNFAKLAGGNQQAPQPDANDSRLNQDFSSFMH